MGATDKDLSTVANALDSLRRLERDAARAGLGEPASLKGAVGWGWHAVILLAHARLMPARDRIDAWLWDYLEEGDAALETERDARWTERKRLSLLELVDLLSEESLPLLEPEFYQGWQDRTTRCRTLRGQIGGIVGASIPGAWRDDLLLLLAVYHRLLRLPAPVSFDPGPVVASLPRLLDLVEILVDQSWKEAPDLLESIERCRRELGGRPA